MANAEETKRKKRGRPPKAGKIAGSPITTSQNAVLSAQTPQLASQALPQSSPPQTSPTKSTPTKGTVLKALPTVRDHTTDQLNEAGDEFIPRETDDAGERKVTPNGQVLDARQYRCRTFYVPNRGDKLFMLATECARVLGYRDSYLLFNKNRSLHKIIANQAEKDDLIQQEILPYSYRSRQIAIVTARSMFRQFGSRLIVNGRRVRDDYWESKARKQGFTEEDAAGEKRPGAAKQREAAAAAHESSLASLSALPHADIIYSNAPGIDGMGASIAPLPMINAAQTDDLRPRDYSSVQRPRHEITGAPYVDQTRPSTMPEILSHAAQSAEFNKSLTPQRAARGKYMEEIWNKPHDSPIQGQRQSIEGDNIPAPGSQSLQSPHLSHTSGLQNTSQAPLISHQQQAGQPQMMTPHTYQQQSLPQSSMVAQSPVRQSSMHHPQMSAQQQQQPQRSPSMSLPHAQQNAYGNYQTQHGMWPPPQPQPSPGSAPQYGQYMGAPQQSPHMQTRHSPMAQHPGQAHTPQLHHQASSGMSGFPGMHQGMYPGGPGQQQQQQQQQQSQRQMYAAPQQ
ncbi:MAG: hypothetical protein INR71_05930, partial [Terriglobus roseus]|nr:hypothetical protein [Terriglobus roseus]